MQKLIEIFKLTEELYSSMFDRTLFISSMGLTSRVPITSKIGKDLHDALDYNIEGDKLIFERYGVESLSKFKREEILN